MHGGITGCKPTFCSFPSPMRMPARPTRTSVRVALSEGEHVAATCAWQRTQRAAVVAVSGSGEQARCRGLGGAACSMHACTHARSWPRCLVNIHSPAPTAYLPASLASSCQGKHSTTHRQLQPRPQLNHIAQRARLPINDLVAPGLSSRASRIGGHRRLECKSCWVLQWWGCLAWHVACIGTSQSVGKTVLPISASLPHLLAPQLLQRVRCPRLLAPHKPPLACMQHAGQGQTIDQAWVGAVATANKQQHKMSSKDKDRSGKGTDLLSTG